jgi:phage-related protein
VNDEMRLQVFFYRTSGGAEPVMVLLHGFIKKSQKTPVEDLKLARQRLRALRGQANE